MKYKGTQYLVGKSGLVIFKTDDRDLLNRFLDCLCDSYEENFDDNDGHEVYQRKGEKYFYSGATWFGGTGVSSRGVSPKPDQTEHFLKKYSREAAQ
jgi:hypothetical protein